MLRRNIPVKRTRFILRTGSGITGKNNHLLRGSLKSRGQLCMVAPADISASAEMPAKLLSSLLCLHHHILPMNM
jgi:hypothetical protein